LGVLRLVLATWWTDSGNARLAPASTRLPRPAAALLANVGAFRCRRTVLGYHWRRLAGGTDPATSDAPRPAVIDSHGGIAPRRGYRGHQQADVTETEEAGLPVKH